MPSEDQIGGGEARAKEAQEPLLEETGLSKAQHRGGIHVASMLLPCPDSSVMFSEWRWVRRQSHLLSSLRCRAEQHEGTRPAGPDDGGARHRLHTRAPR